MACFILRIIAHMSILWIGAGASLCYGFRSTVKMPALVASAPLHDAAIIAAIFSTLNIVCLLTDKYLCRLKEYFLTIRIFMKIRNSA
jgi:hypothetical protein